MSFFFKISQPFFPLTQPKKHIKNRILIYKLTINIVFTFKIAAHAHGSLQKNIRQKKMNVRTKIYKYSHKLRAKHICRSNFPQNNIKTLKKSTEPINFSGVTTFF